MKKLLCIALILTMLGMIMASFSASAETCDEDDVLIVTANGKNLARIKVGTEFLFRVGLNAGSEKIMNGQIKMNYDTKYLSFEPFEGDNDDIESYSFPASLCRSNLICYVDTPGKINYNFSRIKGVAVFNDTSLLFSRFRFKAAASGTTDITYVIQYMKDVNEQEIFSKGTPVTAVPAKTALTIEPSAGCIGDADGDRLVTVMDVTAMQRCAAGADVGCDPASADLTDDGVVSLKDAVVMRRYLAGFPVSSPIGTGLYASEMQ